ncbi:MAG: hypothetical protein WAU70_17305 [Flavobacteriales bacterium]
MRSEVNAFLVRLLLFGSVLGSVLAVVAVTGPLLGYIDYMGAIRSKHQRLASTPSPRLVIIGGSNAAFGINSTELEQAVGMPVVNMALHGSLGYRFMVNEVIDDLREGDVLLVVPEHSQFQTPEKTQDVLYSALELYPPAWRYVPVASCVQVALTYSVKKLQAAVDVVVDPDIPKPEPVYRADGFDERGDLLLHLNRVSFGTKYAKPMEVDRIDVPWLFWAITDRLTNRADRQHFKVLFAWPSQARSTAKASIDAGLVEDLKAHDIAIVGQPEEHVYDDSLFYDTKYHLGGVGRELRTQRLITDLKGAL